MSRTDGALASALAVMILIALLFAPAAPEKRALAPQAGDDHPGIIWRDGLALIDVNRADQALLTALPGIGPALSERIVADRAANGPYAALEDLQRVSGIGPAKIAALSPRATVGSDR